MIGREMAEICKTCDNIDKCSPRGYICPALQKLWQRRTLDELFLRFFKEQAIKLASIVVPAKDSELYKFLVSFNGDKST